MILEPLRLFNSWEHSILFNNYDPSHLARIRKLEDHFSLNFNWIWNVDEFNHVFEIKALFRVFRIFLRRNLGNSNPTKHTFWWCLDPKELSGNSSQQVTTLENDVVKLLLSSWKGLEKCVVNSSFVDCLIILKNLVKISEKFKEFLVMIRIFKGANFSHFKGSYLLKSECLLIESQCMSDRF